MIESVRSDAPIGLAASEQMSANTVEEESTVAPSRHALSDCEDSHSGNRMKLVNFVRSISSSLRSCELFIKFRSYELLLCLEKYLLHKMYPW